MAAPVPDVQQEKTHNALLEGVEKFDSEQLKKTEIQEKNRLPSPDGKVCLTFSIVISTFCRLQTFCLLPSVHFTIMEIWRLVRNWPVMITLLAKVY